MIGYVRIFALLSVAALFLYVVHLRKALAAETDRAVTAERTLGAERAARSKEQAAALGDYNQLQNDCRTDVVAAIRGGRAIEHAVNLPPPAPGQPRAIIGADVLRDAFGEPTAP